MTSVNVVVLVSPLAAVPEMVTVYVPPGAVRPGVIRRIDEVPAGAPGPNDTFTPDGTPSADRFTAEVKPGCR